MIAVLAVFNQFFHFMVFKLSVLVFFFNLHIHNKSPLIAKRFAF
ncbi:hypothetical protein CHCC15291_0468 [Bacillus licheniformis]|nr:hypothetical protein CHCC15291_0468 [Bacillus licheniformis]